MANVYLQDSTLTAIGNAIRTKAGNSNLLLPSEMAAAITSLPSGGGASIDKIIDINQLTVSSSAGQSTLTKKNTYTPTANGDVVTYAQLGFDSLEDFITNGTAMFWVGYLPKMSSATKPGGSAILAFYNLFPCLGQIMDIERLKGLVANTKICLPVGRGAYDTNLYMSTVGGWPAVHSTSTASTSSYSIGTFAFLSDTGVTVKACSYNTAWGTGSPAYANQFCKSNSIICIKRIGG